MDIVISIIKLLGGVALLIYGMKILSTNLKQLSGGKLEKILVSVTDNKFKALLVGIFITVLTQSSSTTTVIVVGLVNANILKLRNVIPVIMGANIGTTITSQILRLTNMSDNSWLALLTPEVLAPILILVGFLMTEIVKSRKKVTIGQMILGVGLLFTGMIMMVDIASGFSELPILSDILLKLSNPILGVLAGTVITFIVQSSAATIGILQALSTTGIITYATTIPITLGQNIGTCGTSILSSIGGSKNAKRAAAVHLYFNIIGTVIFLIVIYTYQYFVGFPFWNEAVDMGQIANFHTLFNVVSTIILLPFIGLIEKLTIMTIRDKEQKEDEEAKEYASALNLLEDRFVKIPKLAIANSRTVIEKMGEISEKNFSKAMKLLEDFQEKKLEKIKENEDEVDKLDQNVATFLVKLGSLELSEQESIAVTTLLKMETEFEKIGDYAYKFAKTIEQKNDNGVQISECAYNEFKKIYKLTDDAIKTTIQACKEKSIDTILEVEAIKEFAEVQREAYRDRHIQRLKEGKCSVESGIVFIELLAICEKIIKHCSNISILTLNYMSNDNYVPEQEFRRGIFEEKRELLNEKVTACSSKYAV